MKYKYNQYDWKKEYPIEVKESDPNDWGQTMLGSDLIEFYESKQTITPPNLLINEINNHVFDQVVKVK